MRSMLQWKTERMESLWLTPLTVRQLLATEAARARARTGGTGRWGALFVLAVIGACGAWLIERRLGGRPFWPERASLHAGVWAVLASWLIENRDSMTRSGWRRAYRILYNLHEQRQGRLPARRIARIALILVISYSFAGGVFWALTRYGAWCRATWAALAGMPLWIWGAALGALAVAGAAILGPARLRSADQAFQRAAKKGQKMYEELVHALAETT
ncbi:MAG: hypothetical protein NTW86_00010 [Candidatus Sumerlaeota bacterium]|nr:hypothetical protein [Candidatus Sumerlaeota bacterium]